MDFMINAVQAKPKFETPKCEQLNISHEYALVGLYTKRYSGAAIIDSEKKKPTYKKQRLFKSLCYTVLWCHKYSFEQIQL